MGTEWEIALSASAQEASPALLETLADQCFALLERLEDELSEFRQTSFVARLNACRAGEWLEVSSAAFEVLRLSMLWAERSQGAFDPTFRGRGEAIPPLMSRLEFDDAGRRVRRTHPGVRVGLGAIGKGYAVDRVRQRLESQGIRNFKIVAGGSSLCFSGEAAPGRPWSWSWAWGSAPSERTPEMPVTESCLLVGVSGTSEQGGHIVSAEGDSPVERVSGVSIPRSVLVASSEKEASAADLDAASTALFSRLLARGADSEAPAWIERAWKVAIRSTRQLVVLLAFFSVAATAVASAEEASVPVAPQAAQAETTGGEEVDLSVDLSASDGPAQVSVAASSPLYVREERHLGWILAPVLMLLFVFLHLRRAPARAGRSKVGTQAELSMKLNPERNS